MDKAIFAMCTNKKFLIGKVPALFLYASAPWPSLRRYSTRYDNLHIYVISAKYGIVAANDIVESYDQRITNKRIRVLANEWRVFINNVVNSHSKTFFFVSKNYAPIVPDDMDKNKCVFPTGKLLPKLLKLKEFVEEKNCDY